MNSSLWTRVHLYFYSWNQDEDKPGQLRLTSELPTTASGKAIFSRLVGNINYTNSVFYFEAQNALTGTYNYTGSWEASGKLFICHQR